MTSNNETVSCQMPRAGNIAKAMTSNGKQFTVTRSTVHCRPLLQVMAGISARFSNFAFVLFCYVTNHLMTGPLGFVLGNIEILGKQNSLFPSGPVIKCLLLHDKLITQGEKRETSRKTWGFLCNSTAGEVVWLFFAWVLFRFFFVSCCRHFGGVT